MPKIHFVNEFKTVDCDENTNVRQAAMKAGIELYTGLSKHLNCHGLGLCGTCKVEVVEGEVAPAGLTMRERLEIHPLLNPETRLACQIRPKSDIKVVSQNAPRWDLRGRSQAEVETLRSAQG